VCIAVAQVLLRFDDERHWRWIATRLAGHLFPRLLGQKRVQTARWARIVQPLLALNACIWFNWLIGAPVKRSRSRPA
jgi:hypothetical protein